MLERIGHELEEIFFSAEDAGRVFVCLVILASYRPGRELERIYKHTCVYIVYLDLKRRLHVAIPCYPLGQ